MIEPRRIVIAAAIVATIALAIVVAPQLNLQPERESSRYSYSLSLSTNATLEAMTLYAPLPADGNESSPIAASIRAGNVNAPDSWEYEIVETERGRMVRIDVGAIPAERRPDGNRYSTYLFGVTAPSETRIDTSDPFGREPTIAPLDGRRERPCPNLAAPDPAKTCFSFDTSVYVSYEAPPEAFVTVYLISNGVNTYVSSGHEMYYERVSLALRGPQHGWVVVEGFASVE